MYSKDQGSHCQAGFMTANLYFPGDSMVFGKLIQATLQIKVQPNYLLIFHPILPTNEVGCLLILMSLWAGFNRLKIARLEW